MAFIPFVAPMTQEHYRFTSETQNRSHRSRPVALGGDTGKIRCPQNSARELRICCSICQAARITL